MISLITILLIAFALSAFFSAAEMAFISSNKAKLRQMADKGSREAKTVLHFHEHPHRFLTTILMGNNISNIVVTTVLTYLFQVYFHLHNEWIIAGITAPFLIIFAELVPKDYGRSLTHAFLLPATFFLKILSDIFYLPTMAFVKVIDFIFNPIAKSWHRSIFVNEKEFRSLIEESVKTGIVSRHEKKIIDTILDFEKIYVESVMIPVSGVAKIEIASTLGDAKAAARQSHSPMLLVYEEDPSLIVGMIYVFDLLFEEDENQGLKRFLRSPIFLPRQISIEKAFIEMKERRQSYAMVTDAEGEVIGAVPIEHLFAA